jgi:hypothetical protein
VRGLWNELRDLGPFPGASGAVNTITAVVGGDDWLDPFFASGAQAFFGSRAGSVPTRLGLTVERHDAAEPALDSLDAADFRPLPAITEGWLFALEGHREPRLRPGLDLGLTGRAAVFDPEGGERGAFGSLGADLQWETGPSAQAIRSLARADAGVVVGDVPRQALFHLGGVGTLPGHPYREQIGDVFFLVRAEASRPVWEPWVTARWFSAIGATGELDRTSAGIDPGPPFSRHGVRASTGAGLGLGWDVLHVDLARGLDGGEWELVVSVDRRFRGWL